MRPGRMLATTIAASLLAGSLAHAQGGFQPNWGSWGSANLGMNTLAHQQAEIARRQGRTRLAPAPGGYASARRPTFGGPPPPPPGAPLAERYAWARQALIRAAIAKRYAQAHP